jgi:dTDP-4-amino-4,6-dideoxygalactose transaminase
MSAPDITEAEITAVADVVRSGILSIGPEVEAFEAAIAARAAARHAIAVSSGTAGLHLCVVAAGIGLGDAVITTPFSFVASANVILYERALPIFVDVDRTAGNIDVELLRAAMRDVRAGGAMAARWAPRGTEGPVRLGAVLPVHAFGQPADMSSITAAAAEYDIPVIEDACEAIGAEHCGRPVGAIGQMGVFAFYPNKQMTTGEGAAIVTNDDACAAAMRSLRNQGRAVHGPWLEHQQLGYNYRLDEMSAALGRVQVSRLDELLAKRAQVAAWYSETLASVAAVELPRIDAKRTTRMSWFVYVVRLPDRDTRDRVIAYLRQREIPSRPYFSPIHLQPFYVERFGFKRGDYPVAERLGDTSLALPFSGVMTRNQVEEVSAALDQALR